MAELTPEQVIAFFKTLDPSAAVAFFDKLKNGSESARTAIDRLSGSTLRASGIVENLKDLGDEVKEKFEAFSDLNFGQLIGGLTGANKEIVSLTAQTALLIGTLAGIKPDAFDTMGDAASGATGDLNRTYEVLSRVAQVDPSGYSTKLLKGLSLLQEAAEPARRFEAGLMAMAGASGTFGDLIQEVGMDLSGLENKTISFADLTYAVAQTAGLTTVQVAKYATELNKIPGALDMVIDTSVAGNQQMHLLDAALKVAAGTGQEVSAVFEDLNLVYREFGTVGEKSLEYVSRMAVASQALKLPLDLVKEYTRGAAQGFRFFGDNSQAALNILGKFGPALKESGLGPKAIADVTQNITRSIGEMGLAQRAFLSGSTGGSGGLAGAYQIELLKRQGKVDEIQQMVEQSLKSQFGGRIVTLEEAAKDQGAASQFTKQVQLLTQGPTKIASSEGEAYAILEAMAKGDRAQPIASKEESLSTSLEIGNSFQERNYNELTAIANKIDLGVQYSSVIANNTSRMLTGTGFNSTNIDAARQENSKKAAEAKILVGDSTAPDRDAAEAVMNQLTELGSIGGQFQEFKNSLDEAKKFIGDKVNSLRGADLGEVKKLVTPEQATPKSDKITPAIEQGVGKNPVTAAPKTASVLTIENVHTCPTCQTKEMTRTAQVVFDGKLMEVRKGEVNHVHTGANLA